MSEVYQLALLLTAKDAASGTLDRFGAKLRGIGKDGKQLSETFDKLRADLNRDLTIGGVGVASLALLKKGIDEAGNYEEKLLDLKQAYSENAQFSNYSADQQQQQIKRIMAMATELGNQLQGNTGDYVDMFTAMNKAGIDAETTMNGAGKAAAYLANVTGAIRNGQAPQLAEDLGMYGKMFDLQGQEYIKAVNTFSAVKDRFNLNSGDLIESSKYFFSTAKGTLNLRGFEGSQETSKLFAFVKRYAGREGSEAGTSLDAVITQFIAHRDKAVKALEKDKGIKLELFDAKGNFQGVENMFAQLEKMKKLNPEERALRLNAIFGEQGARIANAMVEQGVAGWRNITTEMNKAVDVQTLINQKMDTYNAKSEALSGSWQNFKATAFTPLMEDSKKFIDYAGKIVTSLQEFAAEHPGLTKTLGTLALYGSTALVVYSGFKTLTTGVRMFKLASAFSRGEGLIPYLNGTAAAANGASTSLATATTRATGFRGTMQKIAGSSTIRIGLQIGAIMGIEYAITKAIESYTSAMEAKEGAKKSADDNSKVFNSAIKDPELSPKIKLDIVKSQAQTNFAVLNQDNDLLQALRLAKANSWGEKYTDSMKGTWWMPGMRNEGYSTTFDNYNQQKAVGKFRENAPTLSDSNVMREFLQVMRERIPGQDSDSQNARKRIEATAQEAFPASFAEAMRQLQPMSQSLNGMLSQQNSLVQTLTGLQQPISETGNLFGNLQQPMTQTQQTFGTVNDSAQKVPSSFNNIVNSANSVSGSLNAVSEKLANWTPPSPQVVTYQIPVANGDANPSVVPSRAIGGVVEKDGLAMVHAGNVITPARVTKGIGDISGLLSGAKPKNVEGLGDVNFSLNSFNGSRGEDSSSSVVIQYSPQITVNGGSKKAKEEFRALLYAHTKDLEKIVADRMNNGRIRS
jgi:TP901 family phage tail tape measure protein